MQNQTSSVEVQRGLAAHRGTTSQIAPRAILMVLLLIFCALTARRAYFETRRLLIGNDRANAIDLRIFHRQVVSWFSGEDTYAKDSNATYPPGTYPLMWPMYRLDNSINRPIYFVHVLIALGILVWICVHESGAESQLEKLCVAMLPLAMYSTGVTIGNGQLTIHTLTATLGAVLLLYHSRSRFAYELAAAVCMLFALIKPSVSAPFFWIFLFVPRRKWPAMFVAVGYVLLTLLAVSFSPVGLTQIFHGFAARSSAVANHDGYGDLPILLAKIGQQNLLMPLTVATLLAMGIWVWAYRNVDRWLLLGVLALMARLWAYHRHYDDLLNLPAMIALFRLAKGRTPNQIPDKMALIVLAISLLSVPGPDGPLEGWYGTLSIALRSFQTAIRVLMLGLLMHRAWIQRSSDVQDSPCIY